MASGMLCSTSLSCRVFRKALGNVVLRRLDARLRRFDASAASTRAFAASHLRHLGSRFLLSRRWCHRHSPGWHADSLSSSSGSDGSPFRSHTSDMRSAHARLWSSSHGRICRSPPAETDRVGRRMVADSLSRLRRFDACFRRLDVCLRRLDFGHRSSRRFPSFTTTVSSSFARVARSLYASSASSLVGVTTGFGEPSEASTCRMTFSLASLCVSSIPSRRRVDRQDFRRFFAPRRSWLSTTRRFDSFSPQQD